MKPDKRTLLLPILLITIGVGWLFGNLGIAPSIDWIWTLGLAAAGLLTIAVGGIDKVTMVIGPFFLAASCLSVMRQTGKLPLDLELPILVILSGILLLIVRHPSIPSPKWMSDNDRREADP
ncbi:MAG: hypothetical protein ACK6DC_03925 [Planctomycetota bacterium]|jgi:hypothetical protein